MKVLLCHTYYRQRGGEDRCFEDERELLTTHGHQVVEYVRHNDELNGLGPLTIAARTLWNRRATRDVTELICHEKPDIVHCTNTFPLISPAVIHAAHRQGVAVVQALQNYRLLCASSYLMRDERPCEACIQTLVPWPAVWHRCYRANAAASGIVVAMQMFHRALGTWRHKVDAFFTPTQFARQKFIQAGYPPDRMHVKYNTMSHDPGVGAGAGGYVAFVGRLSPEKGVKTLLDAWHLDASLPPLKIVGDGPMANMVKSAADTDARIDWLGFLPEADVFRVVGSASMLIVPSLWYEGFPKTIIEAYAKGTPVAASRLGSLAEVVSEGISGQCFQAGDAADLAATVHCITNDSRQLIRMRAAARRIFETRYSASASYARLLEIYRRARQVRDERKPADHFAREAIADCDIALQPDRTVDRREDKTVCVP